MQNETGFLTSIQCFLSESQAIPLIGPLFVSPFKAALSLIQIIAGVAFALISATFGSLFGSPAAMKFAATSKLHVGLGILSLCYSLVNMLSLGILGFYLQHTIKFNFRYC